MTEFTPGSAALGGLLIGAAASLMLLALGRVAGISGIVGRALVPGEGESRVWRIAFVSGLPLGAALVSVVTGPLEVTVEADFPVLLSAGLLVGFGTRLGSGCTSGHGVCGLARGSARSITATLTFMIVAALTVFVTHHVLEGVSS